jgi:hypothetical protein
MICVARRKSWRLSEVLSVIGLAPVSISSIPGLRVYDPAFLTGVYFLCKGNEVLYVGQSTNIGNRVTTHAAESTKDHDKVFFLRLPASQLAEVESRFIASLKPVHNWVGKKAAA